MNISDIAELAGVSKAAVSRYFNNGYLSDDKRSAIEKVVEETGYLPSAQAQTLRTRKTRQIGIVLPKLSSESCSRVVEGVSRVLDEKKYLMLLANTANNTDKEIEYLDIFRRQRVEGIIFIATVFTPEHRQLLSNIHIPVVIVGQEYEGFNCVSHDDFGAAEALTELLIERGSKCPGFIGVTAADRAAGAQRRRGFTQALEQAGLPLRREHMCIADFTIDSGYKCARELLSGKSRPDSLLCATDNIAIGALQYCRDSGIHVSRDLLIAGIGDTKQGQVASVPLTSAHLHYHTSGEEAAKTLLSMLERHTSSVRRLQLGYEIIERDSTKKTETV